MYYLLYKDLVIEWRQRVRIHAQVFLGLLVLLVISFAAGAENRQFKMVAPAFVWLTLLFSSISSLHESFLYEQQYDALNGLLLIPIQKSALFLSKALQNALFLCVLAVVLWPLTAVLFDIAWLQSWILLFITAVLGCFAISAPGTLLAGMTHTLKNKDVLLPLILYPLLIPVLIATIKSTTLLLSADLMQDALSWIQLLIAFNLIYWLMGTCLFAFVLNETST